MSIPLDRLYHYIESVANEVYGDTIIYHFWPHGSKNINDLIPFNDPAEIDMLTKPQIFCYDQEPLNFDLYRHYSHYSVPDDVHNNNTKQLFRQNLRKNMLNIFDKSVLIHSEKKSVELDKYVNTGFLPVYYWSHALIALDWFRYAKHIKKKSNTEKINFLVYNRSWTGSREYRLKLSDMLIDHNLVHHCKTSVQFVDNECYYLDYVYKNISWRPNNQLENYFIENTTTPCYSADFNENDYQDTYCEVVLETLFDDCRLHLTEKILRPIAMGHPFLLCATAGSLQYLRDYGFKTFNSVINEDYDLISDPVDRLGAVIETMKTITNWPTNKKQQKFLEMQQIAEFNKNYFFSKKFFNLIQEELKTNLKNSIIQLVESNTFDRCITLNQNLLANKKYTAWQDRVASYETVKSNNDAYNIALQLKKLNNK
jgi:hypothetical protein